jgi:hypothetical protein
VTDRETLQDILRKRRVDSHTLNAIMQQCPAPEPSVFETVAGMLDAIRKKEDACR